MHAIHRPYLWFDCLLLCLHILIRFMSVPLHVFSPIVVTSYSCLFLSLVILTCCCLLLFLFLLTCCFSVVADGDVVLQSCSILQQV